MILTDHLIMNDLSFHGGVRQFIGGRMKDAQIDRRTTVLGEDGGVLFLPSAYGRVWGARGE